MITTFLMVSTSPIYVKFGEDCTTRAGCRCEHMMFVTGFCLSRSRPERCSLEGDILRTSIVLYVDFDTVF